MQYTPAIAYFYRQIVKTAVNTAVSEYERLERIAAGDESAFRELFDQYWGNIYGVALAFTKSAELSQDIVQEVFIKVWQKRAYLARTPRPRKS